MNGLRIALLRSQITNVFPLHRPILDGRLILGTSLTVELTRLVPRNQIGRSVGCEFEVRNDIVSERQLSRLLSVLVKSHIAQAQI